MYNYIYIYASQWFDPILDIDINIFEKKTAKQQNSLDFGSLSLSFSTAALDWEGSTSV